MQCIYKITSHKMPERYYIGSAVNFRVRKNSHLSYLYRGLHHNKLLQNHANKYGIQDLMFEVIELISDNSRLLDKEQFYINTLNPFFNISKIAGNTLGTRRNEQTKRLLSQLKIGNKHNLGRKLDDAHKLKISNANKGRIFTEEHKIRLSKASKNRTVEMRKKYRLAQTGKKQSIETKQKISKATRGANNPRWKGGISKTYKNNMSRKFVEETCES